MKWPFAKRRSKPPRPRPNAQDLVEGAYKVILDLLDGELYEASRQGKNAIEFKCEPGPTRDFVKRHLRDRGFGVNERDATGHCTHCRQSHYYATLEINW